jgi:hypothetical protein
LAGFVPAAQDFFAVRKVLLLVGLGPIVAMLAALALWRLWPSATPDDAVIFSLGGQKLRFAATYLRNPEQAEADRIDLTVLAPDFVPGAADPQRIPAAGDASQKGRAQIFITLTPAPKFEGRAAAATPAERYGTFLSPEAQVGDGGLLRRRFEDKSPYAGEDLYLAPPDGEEFFARCQRPKIPSDGLPNTCLGEFRVEGVLAQIRFDPAWLGDWPGLRANTLLLVRGAIIP